MSTDTKAPARPGRRLGATFALIVLVGLVAAYLVWWSKPTAFGGWGNELGGTIDVGTTTNVNMFGPRSGEVVTLHDIEAAALENSADADIDFVACQMRGSFQVGSDEGSLDKYCTNLLTVDGLQLRGSSTNFYIIARITPRKPGVVKLDGMDVSYTRHGWRHLWQTGTEQAGIGVNLKVK